MSEDAQDATNEMTEADAAKEMVAEGAPITEPVADASSAPAADELSPEPVAEEPVAEEPVAEAAPAEEPVADAEAAPADEPVADEAPAEEPVADAASADDGPADEEQVAEETPVTVSEAFGPVRVARVYVCERGHRTTTLWGEPDICQAQPLRSGPTCGLRLYHITELPEQVQKALNPLKASKKASKKK